MPDATTRVAAGRGRGAASAASTPARPASSASMGRVGAPPRAAKPGGLEEENAILRRELREAREQFARILTDPSCAGVGAAGGDGPPTPAALARAQLIQTQRQVQVLTEALVARAELSTELEAVLTKLRAPAADGKNAEVAAWATGALRRLRHITHSEGIADDIRARDERVRAAAKAKAARGAAGPGEPGRRAGAPAGATRAATSR